MSKCSRVCGIVDSSAAIDEHERQSMPLDSGQHVPDEPLVARVRPQRPGRWSPSRYRAKPRSIVMPRAFSSRRRSGSTPVSARHQRALSMIDMPCRPDNEVFHIAIMARSARRRLFSGGGHVRNASGGGQWGDGRPARRDAVLPGASGRRDGVRPTRGCPVSARSSCRRSRSTRTNCTSTRSPRRYTLPVASPRQRW